MTQPYGPGSPQQPQPPYTGQQPAGPPAPPPPQGPVPPAPPYPVAPYGAPVVVRQDAPSAQMAMILGIVGLVLVFLTCIGGFVGIGGIVMAKRTDEEIARSGGMLGGEDKAKIGRITGWIATILAAVGVVFWILYFLFFAALFTSTSAISG